MARHRMRSILAAAVLTVAGIASAGAQEARIGVAAPLSGASELLGRQVRDGARLATEHASGQSIKLQVEDDACTAEGGARAARAFAAAKVRIVVGFLCTESIEAAMPILKDAGIPVIAAGVRTDSLTDKRAKTGWPVFRLSPRADAERDAAAKLLIPLWRDALFAIVDDGTIYARDLAEGFRAAAEQAGLKPVFTDTFRPQMDNQVGLVGRLRKAGATHVLAAGDREDIAIMARDAEKLGAKIVFAGGEALRAATGEVPLTAGTLMVGLPEWAEVADPKIVTAFAVQGIPAEGYTLPAYAATEIAIDAIAADDEAASLTEVLSGREFRTAIGPIRFDGKGDLAANPYRLFRFDGTRFLPLETQ